MENVIWWIRRDLRLKDNNALKHAMETRMPVLPVFIIDPNLEISSSIPRQSFIYAGLDELDKGLHNHGSYLILRKGDPFQILQDLVKQNDVVKIFAEEDFSPYATERDKKVAKQLPLMLVSGLTINHPSITLKADGKPYTVFTPFKNAWSKLPNGSLLAWKPDRLLQTPGKIDTVEIPQHTSNAHFPAGEEAAATRMHEFLAQKIFYYHEDRDLMDRHGTSMLSPYLKSGMLSIHRMWDMADELLLDPLNGINRQGVVTWQNELIWREFYQYILYHFPHVKFEAFDASFRAIAWRDSYRDLQTWQSGITGFPVVDAAMRQLLGMSWMHNRARMITASFLTKDLLINWQEGENWFMQHLVDGDIASNNGGWQWSAGVGTDAAPYFRIFNPILQGKKFDPIGKYIKKWVPELRNVPNIYIHEPWLMPLDMQEQIGVRIGKDYPQRIVDRAMSRGRMLNVYKQAKSISRNQRL
jgi:deoxyribodipyrimidine photo-lyase